MNAVNFLVNRRKVFLHLFFCAIYLLVFLSLNANQVELTWQRTFPLILIALVGIGVAYLVHYCLHEIWIGKRKVGWSLLFLSFIGLGLLWSFILHKSDNAVSRTVVNPHAVFNWGSYWWAFGLWFFGWAKYSVLLFFVEKYLYRWFDRLLITLLPKYTDSIKKASQDKLELSRIDLFIEHFLSNLWSRNDLLLLSEYERPNAVQVDHLVNVRQYALEFSGHIDRGAVPLGKEIHILEHFIEVQQDPHIVLLVEGYTGHIYLPPVTLLELANNIFKYGIAGEGDKDQPVIRVYVKGTQLDIYSSNRVAASSMWAKKGGHVGLKRLRAVLSDFYGKHAFLSFGEEKGIFKVHVQLDSSKCRSFF